VTARAIAATTNKQTWTTRWLGGMEISAESAREPANVAAAPRTLAGVGENRKMRRAGSGGLVYSTDQGGRMCAVCRRPKDACACGTATTPRGDGRVRVGRETQGRGGKTVTLVRGLPVDAAALADIGKRLRAACGTGGTARDGVLELQGDHRQRVLDWLHREGWPAAKLAGG